MAKTEAKPVDPADELRAVRAELDDLRAEKKELLETLEDTHRTLWLVTHRSRVGGGLVKTNIAPLQGKLKRHLGEKRCEALDIELSAS